MLFVTIPTKDLAKYSYMSSKLKEMVYNLRNARKNLESVANASFDKAFAKCIYLFTSESLQCEKVILSQIDSLDGVPHYDDKEQKDQTVVAEKFTGMASLCNYCEEAYIEKYKQLISDNHLGNSLKSLMQNHLRLFLSSLTQLKLFEDVKTAVN
jgi:hypothetical protein